MADLKYKNKLLIIAGPTASGKSNLAVILAKKFNGEVISADSRQVYKGMDIGTGKVTKKEMADIPHHLLNVVSPKKIFTVANFKELAEKKIQEITDRGKLPIICGGTGFYIQSIVNDLTLPEVPPNKKLRKELSLKNTDELFADLKKLDPRRAKDIDNKNPARLIRAIEIAKALGSVPKIRIKPNKNYDSLQIGLMLDQKKLEEKIHTRLLQRIKQGMIAEIKNLREAGLSWKRLQEFGLEYRFISSFLQKKLLKNEMIEKLEIAIRHYAKRQMTWFKKDKRIHWFDPTEIEKIEGEVNDWLKE